MTTPFFSCPMCGKPDASDGYAFCGECEEARARELDRRRASRRDRYACRAPDGCDGHHCRNCSTHIAERGECDTCAGY